MQTSKVLLLNCWFSVHIFSVGVISDLSSFIGESVDLWDLVVDLMKPEMRVRGGVKQGSLIFIYLNELRHKLPHQLSAGKIKWDLQSMGLVWFMGSNYWQDPGRYHQHHCSGLAQIRLTDRLQKSDSWLFKSFWWTILFRLSFSTRIDSNGNKTCL